MWGPCGRWKEIDSGGGVTISEKRVRIYESQATLVALTSFFGANIRCKFAMLAFVS
jgi:hypothetical protein